MSFLLLLHLHQLCWALNAQCLHLHFHLARNIYTPLSKLQSPGACKGTSRGPLGDINLDLPVDHFLYLEPRTHSRREATTCAECKLKPIMQALQYYFHPCGPKKEYPVGLLVALLACMASSLDSTLWRQCCRPLICIPMPIAICIMD